MSVIGVPIGIIGIIVDVTIVSGIMRAENIPITTMTMTTSIAPIMIRLVRSLLPPMSPKLSRMNVFTAFVW